VWEHRINKSDQDPKDVCMNGVIINGYKLRFSINGLCDLHINSLTLNDTGLYDHVGDGGFAELGTRTLLLVYGMFNS
jgi:hypothetical protein